ncbi:hypothetical protein CHUAL_008710 [Chamberlinius hualienensis]
MNDSGFLSDPEGEEDLELEWQRKLNYIHEDELQRMVNILIVFAHYLGYTQILPSDVQPLRVLAKNTIIQGRLEIREQQNTDD